MAFLRLVEAYMLVPALFLAASFMLAGCDSSDPSEQAADVSGSPDSSLVLDRWTYINVDSSRASWGDYDDPSWLRYFGLDMADMNGDGYKDIVSGRYVYYNPGGRMTGPWQRVDLGMNVDGMLTTDVDGDAQADIIGTALPDVYWLEAANASGTKWEATAVAELEATGHVNGQGFVLGQIVKGGKPEVLLSVGSGIHYVEIPSNPSSTAWPTTQIAPSAFDEGIGVADIDGDGDVDMTAWYEQEGGEPVPGAQDITWDNSAVAWWENPGDGSAGWNRHDVGTATQADRFAVADVNGDGRPDIITSEERYPGEEPNASLYWFEAPSNPVDGEWVRHELVTTYSLNNLDAADMDRDGDVDIVTNEHKGPDLRTLIYENNGSGTFTEHVVDRGKEGHLGAQVSDMDGDGDPDIVSHAWDNYENLHLWRNDALGSPPQE